ncbi:cuticle collagen 2-like [Hylobates moloch]|uniref:cuticle collagen 2-like n=1 Tax=Hylobates moloch TaxID=81572 RepID=UPI0013633166|nr:cuticle collagen 2-like [Hylobates moloch]
MEASKDFTVWEFFSELLKAESVSRIARRLRPATPPVRAQGAFVGPTGAGLAGRRPPHLTWRLRPPRRPAPQREINGPRPPLHQSPPPPRPSPGSPGREGYRAGGPLSPSALAQLLSAPPAPPPGGGCRLAGSESASVRELPLHFLPPAAAAPPVPGIPSGPGNCEGRDDGGGRERGNGGAEGRGAKGSDGL